MKNYLNTYKYNRGFTRTLKFSVTPKGGGFTLVETLVAISIFTMSILALLSVLSSGISNTRYAKSKMTASYLAQEGIEYMRNMRDTFVLYDGTDAQNGWNSFYANLTDASVCQNGCYFDDQGLDYSSNSQPMASISLIACSDNGSTCPPLLYDTGAKKYGYAAGLSSGFTRKIQINTISSNEIKVFSTVSWTQGTGTHSITLSESLFNWIE